MRISIVLGGYTPAEADELRRAMGHQRKAARLRAQMDRLKERMIGRGIEPQVAEQVTEEMRIFGNYGFPESHSWSFALIAYATGYLRAHYPADFLAGLLNAQPMGFYAPATLVHDARKHGVVVRPPCLLHGDWDATLEETADPTRPAVRIGWRQIRGLGPRAREALRAARMAGPYQGVEDVVRRTGIGRQEALCLAQAGALEVFVPGRYAAAWEALRVVGDTLPLAPARTLPYEVRELSGRERVYLDYLAVGVCVDGHPVAHLRERLRRAGVRTATQLHAVRNRTTVRVAGLVIARQHPATARSVVFLLVEDETGWINVIVPAALYQEHREAVKFSSQLMVEGRLERQGPVLNVVGAQFRRLAVEDIAHRSHDFR